MEWITESMGLMFKASLYLAAFIGFVFATIYYAKINDKSKEVSIIFYKSELISNTILWTIVFQALLMFNKRTV